MNNEEQMMKHLKNFGEEHGIYLETKEDLIDDIDDPLLKSYLEEYFEINKTYYRKLEESLFHCQSPIEKMFLLSLVHSAEHLYDVHKISLLPVFPNNIDPFKKSPDAWDEIMIYTQYPVEQYKLDFLFCYKRIRDRPNQGNQFHPVNNPSGFDSKIIAVECDGHEFHEKTKEQVARDKARDRSIQAQGFAVFRFSGSEIWKDPFKCVNEILELLI